MDEIDRKLIEELQEDPRQNNTQLAAILGISEVTVRRRVEKLISSGIIVLTALPDLKRIGYPISAYFAIHTEHSRLFEIGELLCQIPHVRFVSYCGGFTNLLIRGDFASTKALTNFTFDELGKIRGISNVEIFFEMETIKQAHNYNKKSRISRTTFTSIGHVDISETDRRLILQLQKNARTPIKVLAFSVGVSEATIHRRINDMVGSGVIELTAVTDDAKIGYPARCLIFIQTEPAKTRRAVEIISQYPEITFVGLVTGSKQLLASVHTLSSEKVSEFITTELDKVEGIEKIETLYVLKVLKQTYTWIEE